MDTIQALFYFDYKLHGNGIDITTFGVDVELALLWVCLRLFFNGFDNITNPVKKSHFLWLQGFIVFLNCFLFSKEDANFLLCQYL